MMPGIGPSGAVKGGISSESNKSEGLELLGVTIPGSEVDVESDTVYVSPPQAPTGATSVDGLL